MIEAIQSVFAQGGAVAYALGAVSLALWTTVWLRLGALRRGFAGDLGTFVRARLTQRSTPCGGVIPSFIDEALGIIERGQQQRLAHVAQRRIRELAFMRSVLRALVAAAPLLGLLGTVAGMVEMFGSLHPSPHAPLPRSWESFLPAGPSLSRGTLGGEATVAGGISVALITTQLGLVISAPGLVAARLLLRREARLQREIQETLTLIRASQGRTP